jgi:uncharacterized LabA/DUF88 family protein
VSKNVAVFVDVANIFYAAKAAGVDIDYVTLLKSATAGRDFIRAYAYTGLDPENENQRQFQNFLGRNGYKVVSKDIRKYGDGKVKANLDIELVVDMMKTARNVDIAVVVSGDGDFAPAIRAVQEMGVRVEVISFRGNTSSDLIDVADQFTDITQLAKVEKTGRSGRRVAASGEDLSMTAVPDKETEGAPRRRGRRVTKVADEAAEPTQLPVAASPGRSGRLTAASRTERPPLAPAARSAAEAIAAAGVPSLRVLPGERLSRAANGAGEDEGEGDAAMTSFEVADTLPALLTTDEAEAETTTGFAPEIIVPGEAEVGDPAAVEQSTGENGAREGDGRRRRRRRGGRGRGRGRREQREIQPAGEADVAASEEETDEPVSYGPVRAPQSTFGSVWDSQLGMNTPMRPMASEAGPVDEEEIEEPEIPEYLLAERRRAGGQGFQPGRGPRGGRGGRGARGAYAAALDRERFGRSGGGTPGWSGDRGGRRDRGPRPGGRPFQGQPRPGGFERSPSAEPWSEVPPDLEEQIRAQLAAGRPQGGAPSVPPAGPEATMATPASASQEALPGGEDARPAAVTRAPRGRRSTASSAAAEGRATAAAPARATRAAASRGRSRPAAKSEGDGEAPAEGSTPTRTRSTSRTRTSAKAESQDASSADAATAAKPAPRPRGRPRKTSEEATEA